MNAVVARCQRGFPLRTRRGAEQASWTLMTSGSREYRSFPKANASFAKPGRTLR